MRGCAPAAGRPRPPGRIPPDSGFAGAQREGQPSPQPVSLPRRHVRVVVRSAPVARAAALPARAHPARGMEGGPPPDAPPSPRAWTPPPSGRSVGGGKPVGHGSGAAASERCAVGRAARDQGRRVGPFPRPSGSHAPTAVRTDAPAVTGGPWLGVGVEPCGVAVPRDQPAGRASSGGGARGALRHACTAPTLLAGSPSALPAGASSGGRPPRVPAGPAPLRRGGACRSGRTERCRRVGPRVASGRAGSGRPVPDLSRPEKRRR